MAFSRTSRTPWGPSYLLLVIALCCLWPHTLLAVKQKHRDNQQQQQPAAATCPWPSPAEELVHYTKDSASTLEPCTQRFATCPDQRQGIRHAQQQQQRQQRWQQQQQQEQKHDPSPPPTASSFQEPPEPVGEPRYIVRFKQYKHAGDLETDLTGHLGPQSSGRWHFIPRTNAASALPTDFALVSIPAAHLHKVRQQLLGLVGFKDMHPDKKITGKLKWTPEGALEGAFIDAGKGTQAHPRRQQQREEDTFAGSSPGRSLLQSPPEAASTTSQPNHPSSSSTTQQSSEGVPPPAPSPQQVDPDSIDPELDPDSIFYTTKPPGRLTTKPTIGLDKVEGKDELRRRRVSLRRARQLLQDETPADAVTKLLKAKVLWDQGFSGKGIKVGVFDTGIIENHPHIRNIKERTNWTHQNSLADGLGHGSFVAGVIGSQDKLCPGFAPDMELYTFKVFTDDQVSYTSWFLDAFNYAIASNLDLVNLSIGGPDYLDKPFVEKVFEVTSNGIIMVSAIGNDGPLYGTLNNPADQLDVIGVGGIDNSDAIAGFSSRGMTTWELPTGVGRMKPDVMAYGRDVSGSKIQGGCRTLSGTSVASPVVAGAVALLASTLPESKRWMLNPATMKQALVEGAVKLHDLNQLEQGNGKIDLIASQKILADYFPRASLSPAALDFTTCPYMWPYCHQPLYAYALPVVYNATILNGVGVTGRIAKAPVYKGADAKGDLLHVTFTYSDLIWPWSGFLAIHIEVHPSAWNFTGTASGEIIFTVESPPRPGGDSPQRSEVRVPLKVPIVPTPSREKRLLWDQYHNLKYPPGYVPRDNLDIKTDILDWHGDHLFTNYHDLFNALRAAGFYVEVLSSPYTCFDARNYGGLLLVDSEEEFYKEEIDKLEEDIKEHGLALFVFAEWYHAESLAQMRFFDDNTRSWWTPITGGGNVPALNDLLKPHGVALGDAILTGVLDVGKYSVQLSYGPNVVRFPLDGTLFKTTLNNVAGKGQSVPGTHAALGWVKSGKGLVYIMGDNNCLDSSHMMLPCFDFLVASLQQLLHKADNGLWKPEATLKEAYAAPGYDQLPQRREGVNFTQYSWVLQNPLTCYPNAPCHYRQGDRACPNEDVWQAGSALVTGAEPAKFDPAKPRRQVPKPPAAALENKQQEPEVLKEPTAKPMPPGATTKRETTAAVSAPLVSKAPSEAPVDTSNRQQPEQQQQQKVPIKEESEEQQQRQPPQEQEQQEQQQSLDPGIPSGRSEGSPGIGKIKIIGTREQQEDDEERKVGILTQIVPWALLICVFGVVAVGFLWRGRANGNVKYRPLGLPRSRPPTPASE